MRFSCYDDLDSGENACLGVEVFGVTYDFVATVRCMSEHTGIKVKIPLSIWDYHVLDGDSKAVISLLLSRVYELEPDSREGLMRHNLRRRAPVAKPNSLRCFSSFEDHTRLSLERRGATIPDEWYRMPVFFFGNHSAVVGSGAFVNQPASFWLDFELQVACVIGKEGTNITASEADEYIAGYTILNDWCARDLELHETRMGIGPAKGRDFAISMGPTLVTPDELAPYVVGDGPSRRHDLRMDVSVNDHPMTAEGGSLRDMHYSFAQMIEHASTDVTLHPGDILASGAVGCGSLLGLGVTESLGRWLQPGDTVDLEVEGLGVLRNVIAEPGL